MTLQAVKGFLERHIVGNAPSPDVLRNYGIDVITLDVIAKHVAEVKDWGQEYQKQYFDIIVELFKMCNVSGGIGKLPNEIKAVLDPEVKRYFMYGNLFEIFCGIQHGHINDYWDAVEAGFAKYCAEKYF